MIKELVLIRLKSLLYSFSASMRKRKNGKSGGNGAKILFILLFAYVAFAFMAMFYPVFSTLADPFRAIGIGWLYFALYGILSFGLMFIGTVFMTKAQLFEARDNELLLALPIKPMDILVSRVVFLLIANFAMELLVAIPALLAWLSFGPMPLLSVLAFVLLTLLLPFFATAVTSLFAWLLSLLTSRIRNKSLMTMVFSLAFLIAYFVLISRMNTYIMELAANGTQLAGKLITVAPLYWFGTAIADGSIKNLILTLLLLLAAFAVVWVILSRNFAKIATAKHGLAKIEYKETEMKTATPTRALLRREISRLLGSPEYLLNAGLGSVFCILGAIVLIFARGRITAALSGLPFDRDLLSGIVAAAIGFMGSMFLYTAPSVSLEGKTLWIIRSMPVESSKLLETKLLFHYIFSIIPAALLAAACVFALGVSFWVIPVGVLFAAFSGSIGLVEDLRHPNLNWLHPTQAVKQSLSVLFTMFIGWGIVIALGVLYLTLLHSVLSMDQYLMICCVALELADRLLIRWLMRKGVSCLEALG